MTNVSLIPIEKITSKIYLIRKEKVMLDSDLAELYGVETKVLIQAVKRNVDRFPKDFMFQLTADQNKILRSQFVTSNWGGRRYLPYVFTEREVATSHIFRLASHLSRFPLSPYFLQKNYWVIAFNCLSLN